LTDDETRPPSLDEQAKPIHELIDHARERDALAKANPGRGHLIAALMTLGRSRKDAEKIVDNARRRVRKAADMADERLRVIFEHEKPWRWTHPREAIYEMRGRTFGDIFERWPLTDIEEALVQHGNVLLIVAMYGALKDPILARLGKPRQPPPNPPADSLQTGSGSHTGVSDDESLHP
jgi:hypothetical protein